jgi:serine/threonine-protein kinase
MSPEQCRGAGNVDQQTDVYALGIMLFEMLAGQPPFIGEGDGEYIVHHIVSPPPALRALAPHVPAELAALIDRLLAKNKDDRPAMAEVRARLEQELSRALVQTVLLQTVSPTEEPTKPVPLMRSPSTLGGASAQAVEAPSPGSPRRWRLVAALGGACVLAGLVKYGVTRQAEPAAVRDRTAPLAAAPPAAGRAPSGPVGSAAPPSGGTVAGDELASAAGSAARANKPTAAGASSNKSLEAAIAAANAEYESGRYDRAIESAYAIFHDYPQAARSTSKPGQRAWLIIGLSSCHRKDLVAVNATYQHLDAARKRALAYGCHQDGIFLRGGKFRVGP